MPIIIDAAQQRKIDTEVKLHINQKLFDGGIITQTMYQNAREIILKKAH
ncbi:MAG: hypothetical protein RSF70_05205 [Ruthenibacterium sp.]